MATQSSVSGVAAHVRPHHSSSTVSVWLLHPCSSSEASPVAWVVVFDASVSAAALALVVGSRATAEHVHAALHRFVPGVASQLAWHHLLSRLSTLATHTDLGPLSAGARTCESGCDRIAIAPTWRQAESARWRSPIIAAERNA